MYSTYQTKNKVLKLWKEKGDICIDKKVEKEKAKKRKKLLP